MITFIVSVYDRPWHLRGCLSSLIVQSRPGQIIVACNSDTEEMYNQNAQAAEEFNVPIISTKDVPDQTPSYGYGAAAWIALETNLVQGDWLCFPSDDSYYVPRFSEIMLEAARAQNLDFVYCDMLYDWRPDDVYRIMNVEPRSCAIDKTCFLVKREIFKGFPYHESGWNDGAFAEQLVAEGVRHGKAPGVLVVHN